MNREKTHTICPICLQSDISYLAKFANNNSYPLYDFLNCEIYYRKTFVFNENMKPEGVFVVHSGKVKISKLIENGKEQIIHIAKEGELLGMRALFSGENYNVSATTLENSQIGFMKAEHFQSLVDFIPDLRDRIIKDLSKELVGRIDFITNMAHKNVRIRFAHALLILGNIYQEKEINLSREDMANYIGMATETLIRVMSEFKKEDIIEINGRKVTIIDSKKLEIISNQ